MRSILILFMALALFVVRPVSAHDYWIEASNFRLNPGDRVLFYLRVGNQFNGETPAFSAEWVRRFRMDDATRKHPIQPLPRDPSGMARVQESGLQVVSFENTATYLELPAERFNLYLKTEGLESILMAREEAGTSEQLGKELYSRCAKALLWAGGNGALPVDAELLKKPVGLTLEIVPEQNPYQMTAPAPMAVQLLYQGQPVAGVTVMALNKSAPNEVQRIQSGPDGRVEFDLHRSGLWLVKAVHMFPAAASAKEDWRSYWASLTFELPVGP